MEYVKSTQKISEEDLLYSYEDGESFKEHPFYKLYCDALGIHLYYDEMYMYFLLDTTKTLKILE